MMPVKGGIQIAKEIRQLGDSYFEQLPILAMTSSMTEESKQMFYDNGFVEVISKPIQVEELRQTMSHCMFL
jgi:CheY-like chemotaxis protein